MTPDLEQRIAIRATAVIWFFVGLIVGLVVGAN